MPNTLLTVAHIAREALLTLDRQTVTAGLVHRDYATAPDGMASGDTISVRKPTVFVANTFNRATGIVVQNANETKIDVVLNNIPDVSFAVTAEDWTLSISDFAQQFLNPAMQAVTQYVDDALLALRADVTQVASYKTAIAAVTDHPLDVLVEAGTQLSENNVPQSERYALWNPRAASVMKRDPLAREADKIGDGGTALRDSSFGRLEGFDNYETNGIPASAVAGTTTGLAFHRSAFALVTRPLALPKGIGQGQGAVVSYKGLGLRVIYGYDMAKKQDVISVDTLFGVKTMDPNRAVRLAPAA